MGEENLIEKFALLDKLRVDFSRGDIWLEESRMSLVHASAMGELRKALYEALGVTQTHRILVRAGYAAGQRDAEVAHKMLDSGDAMDVFRIGPELFSFEGNGRVEIVGSTIDWNAGIFRGEVVRTVSWEAESYIQQFGLSHEPVCWSLVGHASGYTSRFLRRYIEFREVECIGKGDSCCRLVGKPAEEWQQDGDCTDYFGASEPAFDKPKKVPSAPRLQASPSCSGQPDEPVGTSQAFRSALDQLRIAASGPINVLLQGETGVGKELFARWLHAKSDRANEPFVAVNCAAIPTDLIESELFGVQRGAYTGATMDRAGRFERAHKGTILLDEIGDLPLSAQVKLLRVLQNGEVDRLGDCKTTQVDVRVVAATNVDLMRAVEEGRFRPDLYYRLSPFTVTIPPLRERKSDIPILVASLIARFEKRYQKRLRGISDRAMDMLISHSFPGNVRELENLVERGVLVASPDTWIEVEHLFAGGRPPYSDGFRVDRRGQFCMETSPALQQAYDQLIETDLSLDAHERALFGLAMKRCSGNKTKAAQHLGLTRRQFTYKWKMMENREASGLPN